MLAGPMPGDPYSAPPPARPFASEVGADPDPAVGVRIATVLVGRTLYVHIEDILMPGETAPAPAG